MEDVIVVDVNAQQIDVCNDKNLDNLPVYEPGLKEVIQDTRGCYLFFSIDTPESAAI